MSCMETNLLIGVLSEIEVGHIDYNRKNTRLLSLRSWNFILKIYLFLALLITNITSCTGLAGFSGFGTSRTSYCRWNPCKQQLAQGRILQTTTAKKLVGGAKKFGFLLPKKAGTSPKKNSHGRCKEARRRIIKMKSDEEEENDEEEIYYDKEGMDVEIKLEIPSRKLPYRWARATRFVEKTSDAEDEQEEKKDNVQGK